MKVNMNTVSAVLLSFCVITAMPGMDALSASASEQSGKQQHTIASFRELPQSSLELSSHIAYDELMEMLPDYVYATTSEGGEDTFQVPVTWTSDPDYNTTDESYYFFQIHWDHNLYPLSDEFNLEGCIPFYEVLINDESQQTHKPDSQTGAQSGSKTESQTSSQTMQSIQNGTAASSVSTGIKNIVERAYQEVFIPWTPQKNIDGYYNSLGILTATYDAGVTYHGIPYGQQIDSGKYMPNNASFDTFLNAVKDSKSIFYTSRGSYGSRKNSLYYANDCSAFASYALGIKRMTTYTIARSELYTKVSDSIYDAQPGDLLNKDSSHVVVITDMIYDAEGNLKGIEISEQTPSEAVCHHYTPEQITNYYLNDGYKLLRYKDRDSVTEPEVYTGYQSPALKNPAEIGSRFYAHLIDRASWQVIQYEADKGKISASFPEYLWVPVDNRDSSSAASSAEHANKNNAAIFNAGETDTGKTAAADTDAINTVAAEMDTMKTVVAETIPGTEDEAGRVLKPSKAQTWLFTELEDGSYAITSMSDNKALMVSPENAKSSAGNADSAVLTTGTWQNNDTQKWFVYGTHGGCRIVNASSGQCLRYDGTGTFTLAEPTGGSSSSDLSMMIWRTGLYDYTTSKGMTFVETYNKGIVVETPSEETSPSQQEETSSSQEETATSQEETATTSQPESTTQPETTTPPETTSPDETAENSSEGTTLLAEPGSSLLDINAADLTGKVSIKVTTKGPKLSWDASAGSKAGADSYLIFRREAEGAWQQITSLAVSESSYTDKSVISGKTYYYLLAASSEESTNLLQENLRPVAFTYVEAPIFTAPKNTADGIKVTWSTVAGAAQYIIYRKTSSTNYTRVTVVDAPEGHANQTGNAYTSVDMSIIDTSIGSNNGKLYTYTVKAVGKVSNSSYYAGKPIARLTRPVIQNAYNLKGFYMRTIWSVNAKASGYQLQYASNSSMANAKTANITSGSTSLKSVKVAKGVYYTRVRGYIIIGGKKYYSAWSAKKKVPIKA